MSRRSKKITKIRKELNFFKYAFEVSKKEILWLQKEKRFVIDRLNKFMFNLKNADNEFKKGERLGYAVSFLELSRTQEETIKLMDDCNG